MSSGIRPHLNDVLSLSIRELENCAAQEIMGWIVPEERKNMITDAAGKSIMGGHGWEPASDRNQSRWLVNRLLEEKKTTTKILDKIMDMVLDVHERDGMGELWEFPWVLATPKMETEVALIAVRYALAENINLETVSFFQKVIGELFGERQARSAA